MTEKQKLFNNIIQATKESGSPFRGIQGNLYAIFRGIKVIKDTHGEIEVLNACNEEFVTVESDDSLKIINHFLLDYDFNLGRHIVERQSALARQVDSYKKTIKNKDKRITEQEQEIIRLKKKLNEQKPNEGLFR